MNIDLSTNNYGYIFHLIRLVLNKNTKDVAKACDISENWLHHIEEMNDISKDVFLKLCEIYNITPTNVNSIHELSKNKYKFEYKRTLREILDYYIYKETYLYRYEL